MNVRAAAVCVLNSAQDPYFNYEQKIAQKADDLHLSRRDRDFLYLLVKGVILHRSYLDFVIEMAAQRPVQKFEKSVLNLLRLGVFQYLELNTPAHAFTNETVTAARQLNKFRATSLINAVLRHLPMKEVLDARLAALPESDALALRSSHPRWLIERWIARYGLENARRIAEFNNRYQPVYFRHNPLKISWNELHEKLIARRYGVQLATDVTPVFFFTDRPGDLLRSDFFRQGYFSVQDFTQSLAVRLLDPHEGDLILDVCAAPGGKTTMIAQLAGRRSTLWAYDVSPDKVVLMRNEGFRLGIDFVNYGIADARSATYPSADKILIDVPCSGTGVMARRADLRWNRSPEDLEELITVQREILMNVSRFVKPGGVMVYSTCSIEPEENWQNIEWFLEREKEFYIEAADRFGAEKWVDRKGAVLILPHIHQTTGAFAVRLLKKQQMRT